MTFTTPLALTLFLALPFLIWSGRPVTRRGSARAWTSLSVRCLMVLLLVLGLAGAQIVHSADELAVVYLVDASDSIPQTERERALDWVAAAVQAIKPDDRAAVVVFAADALVDRPLSHWSELAPVTSVPKSLNTDIESAIRLGLALLPAGVARRAVLLSDGVETMGDALDTARLAAASGMQIDVVPLGQTPQGSETLLTSVTAPTRLAAGDLFDITVTAESDVATQAVLLVLASGVVVHEQTVSLTKGENRFTVPLAAGSPGFARYRVQLTSAADNFYQNNELATFTEITGPPQVLLVRPPAQESADGDHPADESDQLALALAATGISVDRVQANLLSQDLASLNDYATIVLVDVNAKHLGPRRMALLQRYVRDLGGGLVAVGGPESYAPGGYYRTPLEELLPVEMQLKDQERRSNLTMLFVIDKSGSMADTSVGGIPKVELAKEAIIRSLDLLGPMDRAGVVAFDGSAMWAVPIQEVTDPDGLSDLVGSIRASGGTDIFAGLSAASEVLPDDPATMKHIVLLTDGGASQAGNPEITQEMHDEHGITLSVVAIGEGYAPWIEQLPQLGEGRFHFAYDPDTIPEIFTQETSLATRSYIIEELFWPTLVQHHPIVSGISATPPLAGYIGTSSKLAAKTILATHLDDPLLAAWQYGLGKSVAWTSDATGRWATEWVTWAGFPTFWEQLVKWTITQERGNNVETEVSLEGGRARVLVEATSSDGDFMNDLQMITRVVDPLEEILAVEMQQVAPGRYQGSFVPQSEGAHLIRIAGSREEEKVAQTAGWVLGYSPEYQRTEPNHEVLQEIAQVTGGNVLVEPWESLAHDMESGRIRQPVWPWLTLAAVFMLPMDIALRRLSIGRQELSRAWSVLRSRLPSWRATTLKAPARSEGVDRLFQAKQRASDAHARTPMVEEKVPFEGDERLIVREEPPEAATPPDAGGLSLAGELLKRRKRNQEEQRPDS